MPKWISLDDLKHYEEPIDPYLSQLTIPWPLTQNSVIITNMNTKFNHRQTAGLVPGASFKNCRLSALTQRFRDPGHLATPTGQGFSSSLLVLMGTPDERTALVLIHIIRIIMSKLPNLPKRPMNSPMVVCNRVSSGFYEPLDTQHFEENDTTRVVVHTESFSAVRYLIQLPGFEKKVSFSFFPTGNFIVTGLDTEQAKKAFVYVLPVLERNRLNKTVKPSADLSMRYVKEYFRQFLEDYEKDKTVDVFEYVERAFNAASSAVVTRNDKIEKFLRSYREKRIKEEEPDDDHDRNGSKRQCL